MIFLAPIRPRLDSYKVRFALALASLLSSSLETSVQQVFTLNQSSGTTFFDTTAHTQALVCFTSTPSQSTTLHTRKSDP